MPSCVPSRKVAALAVAASGLAAVLSGAFAPAATAAPASPILTAPSATSATAAAVTPKSSWFVDPRTPAQRRAAIAVPKKPNAHRGKVRETRAVYRTRAGALAVPARFALGHQLSKGQALTLDGRGLYPRGSSTLTTAGRNQLVRLAGSLTNASSVRCEGYADYTGGASKAATLAKNRAAKVCRRLATENPGMRTSTVGYGLHRPAVVGGASAQRDLNRRVVIQMTGTRPVSPSPVKPVPPVPSVPSVPSAPQTKVPGAPVLDHVTGADQGVTFGFAAPATDGGSPITGYQVDAGTGWEAVQPVLSRSSPTACRGTCGENLIYASLTGLTPEATVSLRVRALNEVGAGGPSNTLEAVVFGHPSAPTNLTVVGGNGTLTTTFGAPEHDGGTEVDSYAVSYDDGETWAVADVGSAPYTVTKTGLTNGTTYDVRVRAANHWGSGPSASGSALVATVPSAPSLEQPELDGTSAYVVWAKPESDGGAGITSYELSTDGGQSWRPFLFTDIEPFVYQATVTGLTYGQSYDVQVRAFNDRGRGAASNTHTITPVTVPDAPTAVMAMGSGSSVTIAFTAPAFDGGTAITG